MCSPFFILDNDHIDDNDNYYIDDDFPNDVEDLSMICQCQGGLVGAGWGGVC